MTYRAPRKYQSKSSKTEEPAPTRESTPDELELAACRRLYSDAAELVRRLSESECFYDYVQQHGGNVLPWVTANRRGETWAQVKAKLTECNKRLAALKEKGIDVEKLF